MNQRALPGLLAVVLLAAPIAAEEEPPYDIEQKEVTSEKPPFKLERPNDSWLFIKLDKLQEQLRAKGEDTTGFRNLRARLWWGAAKANLFLFAYGDPSAKDLEALGKARLERVKGNLEEAKVKSAKMSRIGKRQAFVFELEGKPRRAGAKPLVLMFAISIREEDAHVFEVSMEVEAENERAKEAREDFQKLLKSKLKL